MTGRAWRRLGDLAASAAIVIVAVLCWPMLRCPRCDAWLWGWRLTDHLNAHAHLETLSFRRTIAEMMDE